MLIPVETRQLTSTTLPEEDSSSRDALQLCVLLLIINWVVWALNADWLKAVVYQTVYHGYDKTFILTALIMLLTSL